MSANGLAQQLIQTWTQQGHEGFLLSDPASAEIATTEVHDAQCGVNFRFRWMPHREVRGDVAELQRRGILNAKRDESVLFRDPRDPSKRHCFLCADNIRECHPMERLVPLNLAGQEYLAGANFAWIEHNHFTVMSAEHTDQNYSEHTLQAMCELHHRTDGAFRVLYNGPGAGATIPWHLHYQITTTAMPIEEMPPGAESAYPTAVHRYEANDSGLEQAHAEIASWLRRDREHHSVNILIAPAQGKPSVCVFPRDQRRSTASGKGLVGGFEVAGDFVLSAAQEEQTFMSASPDISRSILSEIRPVL